YHLGRKVLERLEERDSVERTATERQPVQQVAVAHVPTRPERRVVERVLAHVDTARVEAELALGFHEEPERAADIECAPHGQEPPHEVRALVGVRRGARVLRRADVACAYGTATARFAVVALRVHVVVQRPSELTSADLDDPSKPRPPRRPLVQRASYRRNEHPAGVHAPVPSARFMPVSPKCTSIGNDTRPFVRDGFITSKRACCSRQSYTVPSSLDWIASVTR